MQNEIERLYDAQRATNALHEVLSRHQSLTFYGMTESDREYIRELYARLSLSVAEDRKVIENKCYSVIHGYEAARNFIDSNTPKEA